MAAYAALVSVMHIIDNLHLHPTPPISLNKEQVHRLTQKVSFLQEFLESYNSNLDYSKEADPLQSRIASAAYAAEDAIESHIFYQITNNNIGEKMSSDGLYEALAKAIEEMALIEKEAIEIKRTVGFQNQVHTKSTTPADSSRSSSSSLIHKMKSRMVGAEDVLLELKDKLTSNRPDLQTIPIVGAGGLGKTTLALNIYQDRLIEEHFDIRSWVTISQEYNIRQILKQVLTQLNKESSEGELGEMLHKHLYGRKYMIILDDMWSVEAWDEVKRFLPDNKNGSRIVITTRLTTLASVLPIFNGIGMKLLDENYSWDLLSNTVFGENGCCPSEFEKIGKKIGRRCKGLPLSIVVVGGLLAKSEQRIEYWEYVEENLNAIVNLEDEECCLKTLYMSYKQLPVHLKPCFLYMGIYCEDHEICISDHVRLWVAEGFLKPISGERLEDVARVYLKDLIDRNLVLIHKLGSIGSIKYCKVHDLLRDLCLREAQKEGFYTIYPGHEAKIGLSRICMPSTMPEIEEVDTLLSAPLARSLILNIHYQDLPPDHIYRLMRIVQRSDTRSNKFLNNVHQLVNLRFFSFTLSCTEFPSSIRQFWNLQTLVVRQHIEWINEPVDIWYMSRIRHLDIDDLYLSDPPSNVQAHDINILQNLQTLGKVKDFKCSEQVVKRIPNIRKLEISYEQKGVDDRFRLTNLDCLYKLESLNCNFNKLKCPINYPQSLKKLSLGVHGSQYWEDILDKIGALPLLQKLRLKYGAFKREWETSEGQFCSLKFLYLGFCGGLRVWKSKASHFPRLEQLHLHGAHDLEEIPSDFTEISTLRLIRLNGCGDSAIGSASRILEEQQALYGEEETDLQVQVHLWSSNNPALKRLRSPNFHVTTV
ncbi:hypothetical protein OROHE_021425 [Orobanche hederae]